MHHATTNGTRKHEEGKSFFSAFVPSIVFQALPDPDGNLEFALEEFFTLIVF